LLALVIFAPAVPLAMSLSLRGILLALVIFAAAVPLAMSFRLRGVLLALVIFAAAVPLAMSFRLRGILLALVIFAAAVPLAMSFRLRGILLALVIVAAAVPLSMSFRLRSSHRQIVTFTNNGIVDNCPQSKRSGGPCDLQRECLDRLSWQKEDAFILAFVLIVARARRCRKAQLQKRTYTAHSAFQAYKVAAFVAVLTERPVSPREPAVQSCTCPPLSAQLRQKDSYIRE
jgi:hypothetical protein